MFLIRHRAMVSLLGSLAGLGYMFVITGELSGELGGVDILPIFRAC